MGGIGTGKDAYEKIRAGASLVQVIFRKFSFFSSFSVFFCPVFFALCLPFRVFNMSRVALRLRLSLLGVYFVDFRPPGVMR